MFRRRSQPSHLPLYEFVRTRLDETGRFVGADADLPDEARREPGDVRWAPGAMDGAFGHHGGWAGRDDRATEVRKLLVELARKPSERSFRALYKSASESDTLDFVDPLLEQLVAAGVSTNAVRDVARRFVRESADRAPVKLGLALLGACGLEATDVQLVRVMGAHDEFALFAAVALTNGLENPESELWALAAALDGWGRIQCVERLKGTEDAQIKRWMLLEGYKNSIMYEYLAYICADTGDLLGALREAEPSRALLSAAGDLIQALIEGGPAEDVTDFDDGIEVAETYLELMQQRAETLDDLLTLLEIARFAPTAPANEALLSRGWTTSRCEVLARVATELAHRPAWRGVIDAGLNSQDQATWWRADRAAKALGIDTFQKALRRIEADPLGHDWFGAWQQADGRRAEQLVDAARRLLPLEELPRGPKDSLGMGPEFRVHQALDWTLQALRHHPGVGGDLLELGLKSAAIRNRNMALNALKDWPVASWPPNALSIVREVSLNDPKEQTRELASEVAGLKDV